MIRALHRRRTRAIARIGNVIAMCAALSALPLHRAMSQTPTAASATFDHSIPPGANFDKADFRLWLPPNVKSVRGIALLVPGSNGDGRAQVIDTVWQAFAVKHQLALVGVRLTDKPHDQNFLEDYIKVSQGSGQALLDALAALGATTKHPELATAPMLLWGMSAGGQFNYEFVAWKPERVIAFVVNKGGVYYSALLPRESRLVPGMLFVGGKDLEFRTNTIVGLFAVNRRAGALWALAEEPGAAHIVGRSRDVALVFFEDMLALRHPPNHSAGPLLPLTERSGLLGDLKQKTFQMMADLPAPTVPTAWLATERIAKSWASIITSPP